MYLIKIKVNIIKSVCKDVSEVYEKYINNKLPFIWIWVNRLSAWWLCCVLLILKGI